MAQTIKIFYRNMFFNKNPLGLLLYNMEDEAWPWLTSYLSKGKKIHLSMGLDRGFSLAGLLKNNALKKKVLKKRVHIISYCYFIFQKTKLGTWITDKIIFIIHFRVKNNQYLAKNYGIYFIFVRLCGHILYYTIRNIRCRFDVSGT